MSARSGSMTRLDRLAIGLSGLCAAHCVATVVLLGALSSLGHFFANPLIHEVGLALAVLIAAVAFTSGVIRHGALGPLVAGGLGLALMASALFVPHGMAEAALTLLGVSFVSLGHWINSRSRRSV